MKEDFIDHLASLSLEHAHARELWTRLVEAMPEVPEPTNFGGTPETSDIQFVWDNGDHHLEIDSLGDGYYEWLYLDRSDDALKDSSDVPLKLILPIVEYYLRLCIKENEQ
jgi:hypothetical protein